MMAGVARNAVALLVTAMVCLPASVSGLERAEGSACAGSSALDVAGTRDATVLALVKALRVVRGREIRSSLLGIVAQRSRGLEAMRAELVAFVGR